MTETGENMVIIRPKHGINVIVFFPILKAPIKNNINLGLGCPGESKDNVIYNVSHWKKGPHLDKDEKLNVRLRIEMLRPCKSCQA